MREQDGVDKLLQDVHLRQRNTLPPDIIRNDSSVDDIFWHGPSRTSKIQRAGVIVFGLLFVLCGLSLASIIVRQSRIALVVPLLFFAVGIRLVYNGLMGRGNERKMR